VWRIEGEPLRLQLTPAARASAMLLGQVDVIQTVNRFSDSIRSGRGAEHEKAVIIVQSSQHCAML